MCAEIRVPDDMYDEPAGPINNFPQGTYIGEIEPPGRGFYVSDLADWTPPQKRLGLQFGSNEPVDKSPSPGAMKHFADLTIEVDGHTLADFAEGRAPDEYAKNLRGSLRLLTRLALALGFIEKGQPLDLDGFIGLLEDGTFDRQKVAFRTYHTQKREKDGVWVNTGDFWAA